MNKALGIVNFEHDSVRIEGISNHRPLMSASFLGRYRLMDFPISNFTNSNIDRIHIYVKEKPRSVYEHVGTGRHYNINSKNGKLRVMYGEKQVISSIYNTDVQAFLQNESFILEETSDYVVVAPSHFMFIQNFRKIIQSHIDSGVDITLLTKKTSKAKDYFLGCTTVQTDKEKRVMKFDVNKGQAKNREIFLESFVMKKSLFIQLCHQANRISSIYWFKDILGEILNDYVVRAHSISSNVYCLNDLKSYYDANLIMTDHQNNDLFDPEWPIYTKTSDSVPAYYGSNSVVKKSLVANGCVIEGTVENCVIGRNVHIKEGSVVKNCLILPSCEIGEDKHLEGLVIDKHVVIEKASNIIAKEGQIIYLNRFDRL